MVRLRLRPLRGLGSGGILQLELESGFAQGAGTVASI
jgi:hypothetical protein